MDENPYEAPQCDLGKEEIPRRSPNNITPDTSVIVLWRIARNIFLFGVVISAACFFAVVLVDPQLKGISRAFSNSVGTGLTIGVVATMAGGFLLIVSHLLVKRR